MSGAKPPYRIPMLAELPAHSDGPQVVSTFSGGGGSCLGYRMAGFRVLWANEFVAEAQATYRANHPDVLLDDRDIREVQPSDILTATGLQIGELDLLDGSPPCCGFSMSGKREKAWGKQRSYSDGKVQRIETLFNEYIRLLNGLQPKTFIAENVPGLVRGVSIGYFKEFLSAMKSCGYRVSARVVNAKWLGVPQARERLIFIGVRDALNMEPVFPKPLPYVYSVRDALHGLADDRAETDRLLEEMAKSRIGEILRRLPKRPAKPISADKVTGGSYFNLIRTSWEAPCPTLTQLGAVYSGPCHPEQDRRFTIAEVKRLTSLPDDYVLTGTYRQQYERAARMVPPVMMMHIAKAIKEGVLDKCKTT